MKKLMMLVFLSASWAATAGAETIESDSFVCDEIRSLRIAGDLQQAVEAAEACLEHNPSHVDAKMELAHTLVAKDLLEDAETWTSQVLKDFPDHGEALVLAARIEARRGEFETARTQLDDLDSALRQSAEVRRFEADLALWQGDYETAIIQYTNYLDERSDDGPAWTNLGHANRQTGQSAAAKISYAQGCNRGDQPGCTAYDDLQNERATRYFARFEPSYSIVEGRPDGQRLQVAVGTEPTPETSVELGYHAIRRGFTDDAVLTDLAMTGAGRWTSPTGPRLGVGGGWTFDVDFSPRWNAFVEGGWVLDSGLDSGLRLWRLQFPAGGTTVLNPSMTYYTGPWMFDARYYMGIDGARDLDHTVAGRIAHFFGDHTSLHVGGGVGTRPDYLEVSPLTDVPLLSHYTARLGGTLGLGDHHRLRLDFIYRHEGGFNTDPTPSGTYRALEIGLGYTAWIW